jgi:hypothetical protein
MNNLVNNWIFGEISPKLGGRFDLALYAQGCERLSNFRPMPQGGITRRPPLKHVTETGNCRIIPFTLSSGESFIIELSELKIRILRWVQDDFLPVVFLPSNDDFLASPYSLAEAWEVQYAQYYDRLYFVHKDHQPQVLIYSASSFSLTPFVPTNDMGENLGESQGNYPSVVGICQNRLWLASTLLNPYTIWVSRPPYGGSNNHHIFTTYDMVTVETEVIKDTEDWPYTTNDEGETVIDFSNSAAFLETTTDTEEVINAKCGMELELASGRNDTIKWISGMDNIFIGTEANEWMCPYDIDPTKQGASMQSAYGSLPIQPQTLSNGVFFIQRGYKLREITYSQNGTVSNDLTYTADHILSAGVRQLITMNNPEPLVVCLLNDGTLAVLSYDKMNGTQGWSRWDTQGTFVSIATYEDTYGQQLYAVVKRGESYYIERFDFTEQEVFLDRAGETLQGDLEYTSKMVGNRFDFNTESGSTIGKSKKAKEVWVRCLDSGRIRTGVEDKYMQKTRGPVGNSDYRIPISGGARKELKVIVESVAGDPLTLLAMTYEVEVN